MLRQKNNIFLQGLYSEDEISEKDKSKLVDSWDLFRYESMVEHNTTPQTQPLTDYENLLLDYIILKALTTKIDYNNLKRKNRTLYNFFSNGYPNQATIQQNLFNYNYNEICKPCYTLAFNDAYIPNDYNTRSVVENSAKLYAINESQIQFDYLKKCESYLNQQSATINQKKYLNQVIRYPNKQRTSLILSSLEKGSSLATTGRPLMDMYQLTNGTYLYLKNTSEFQSVLYANVRQKILGRLPPYQFKHWIWSGKAHTRHKFMHGQTVPVNEPFIVTNERNGEACALMYPRDYSNDPTGSNVNNCGCGVTYDNKPK